MNAPTAPVSIYKGDSVKLDMNVRDKNKKPVSLAGAFIIFTLKMTLSDPTPTIVKASSTSTEVLITDEAGGLASIFIPGVETDTLTCRKYIYDVRGTLGDGSRHTFIAPSDFKVNQTVGSI